MSELNRLKSNIECCFCKDDDKDAQVAIRELLTEFPAAAIFGPRQVGKTTLADAITSAMHPNPVYLDPQNPADQAKLALPQHSITGSTLMNRLRVFCA